MKISIITINYNNKVGLEKTIKSVIQQTNSEIEYIVVDGASTDGSKEVIDKYAHKITKWVSEPDTGIYNAMNKGVLMATGSYLLFLNSGDYLVSDKIFDVIQKQNLVGDIIGFDIFKDYGQGKLIFDYNPKCVTLNRLLKRSLFHQSTLIKKSLFITRLYNENYKMVSDWIFWLESIILEKANYQHISVPITIFDMGGVSNTNKDKDMGERRRYLANYINMSYLDVYLSETNVKKISFTDSFWDFEIVLIDFIKRAFDYCFRKALPLISYYKKLKFIESK